MEGFLIILTALFTLVGCTGFISFLALKYYAVAVWCFLAGITNFFTTMILFLKLRNRLTYWYGLQELESFIRLAFGLMAISLFGTVYYAVYFVLAKAYESPDADVSTWLRLIFSGGTFLSAALLSFWTDRTQKQLLLL